MISKKSIKLSQPKKIPDLKDIRETVDKLIEFLPEKTRTHFKEITFLTENYPDQFILDDLKIDNKYDLLSFYKKNITKNIFLYRGPIVRYSFDTNQSLSDVLKKILICKISYCI